MTCNGCGNKDAYHVRAYVDRGNMQEICNLCSEISISDAGVPDAYLPRVGMTFGALCDDSGNPIPIQSKRHKKEVMDKLGVRECPERLSGETNWIDGTRAYRRKQFDKERPQIRETLRKWNETRKG